MSSSIVHWRFFRFYRTDTHAHISSTQISVLRAFSQNSDKGMQEDDWRKVTRSQRYTYLIIPAFIYSYPHSSVYTYIFSYAPIYSVDIPFVPTFFQYQLSDIPIGPLTRPSCIFIVLRIVTSIHLDMNQKFLFAVKLPFDAWKSTELSATYTARLTHITRTFSSGVYFSGTATNLLHCIQPWRTSPLGIPHSCIIINRHWWTSVRLSTEKHSAKVFCIKKQEKN